MTIKVQKCVHLENTLRRRNSELELENRELTEKNQHLQLKYDER